MNRPGTRLPIVSRWKAAAGFRVHSRVSTVAAPPGRDEVVLVHGLGVSSRYMVPLMTHLASWTRVHAPDLPGFGLNPGPRRALDVELSSVLAAWISATGLDQPVVVANAFGCQIAVDLAVHYPCLVSRPVLNGPTVDPRARSALGQIARWLLDSRWDARLRNLPGFGHTLNYSAPLELARVVRLWLEAQKPSGLDPR